MGYLHYGSDLRIELDETMIRRVMESVAAHATRGGWVIATDTAGRTWSFLVSAGVHIWINESE